MSYYALFPHTPRVDVDAIAGNFLRLRVLTPMRLKLFRVLIDQGFDFMHSDADAFWLRDPRPWLAEQTGYDLLCSQGTDRPGTQYRTHHIVLCAGFFHCRANARTRALWAHGRGALERLPKRPDSAEQRVAREPRAVGGGATRARIPRGRIALVSAPAQAGAERDDGPAPAGTALVASQAPGYGV